MMPFPNPGVGVYRSAPPCRRERDAPGAGVLAEGNCPFEGAYKAKAALAAELEVRKDCKSLMSWLGAPGLLTEASSAFSSGEHSVQGKAGAAWGCRPTEHPLPSPAGNPASSRHGYWC